MSQHLISHKHSARCTLTSQIDKATTSASTSTLSCSPPHITQARYFRSAGTWVFSRRREIWTRVDLLRCRTTFAVSGVFKSSFLAAAYFTWQNLISPIRCFYGNYSSSPLKQHRMLAHSCCSKNSLLVSATRNTGMLLLHAPPRCALTSVAVVMVMAEENIFGLRYRGVTRV